MTHPRFYEKKKKNGLKCWVEKGAGKCNVMVS